MVARFGCVKTIKNKSNFKLQSLSESPYSMLEIATLMAVVSPDAADHGVCQKLRNQKCKATGNNTYQIVWRGNSDIAIEGVGVRPS